MSSILIVDDEVDLLELVEEAFQLEGFTVHSACNGQKALEILKANKIDVVLSDAMMEGISGMELLGKIKALPQRPLFYFVTGIVEECKNELMGTGVTDVILKPYSMNDLVARIQKDLVDFSQ